jgi:Zn-dependent protease with chaperone function
LSVDPADQQATDYLIETNPYSLAIHAERLGIRFGSPVTYEQAQAAGSPGWRDLQPAHYEHPTDRQMREAWGRDGAMAQAIQQTLQQVTGPLAQREYLLGRVRLGEQQLPHVYELAQRSASMLNQPMPEVYLRADPAYNAEALSAGHRQFVTLHSSLVEDFTPDELLFVIGHEIGHIRSEHTLYKVVGQAVIEKQYRQAQSVASVGGGLFGIATSIAGSIMEANANRLAQQYLTWRPYTELTCDRAGLIACGSVEVASSALAKLMIGSATLAAHLNLRELLRQYDDAQAADLVQAVDPTEEVQNSHPYTCYRIRLLQAWAMGSRCRGLAALRHPTTS